jgi:hypothetical protein
MTHSMTCHLTCGMTYIMTCHLTSGMTYIMTCHPTWYDLYHDMSPNLVV